MLMLPWAVTAYIEYDDSLTLHTFMGVNSCPLRYDEFAEALKV